MKPVFINREYLNKNYPMHFTGKDFATYYKKINGVNVEINIVDNNLHIDLLKLEKGKEQVKHIKFTCNQITVKYLDCLIKSMQ